MKDKLFTPSYGFILAANFLLYFGFWLLTPVLPFYLCNGSIQNFSGWPPTPSRTVCDKKGVAPDGTTPFLYL
jgi:hypothetical protein